MWMFFSMISYAGLLIFSVLGMIGWVRKKGTFRRNIIFALISCMLIIFFSTAGPQIKWFHNENNEETLKPLGAYEKAQVKVGENGILNEDAFISLGEEKENFALMQEYIATSNGVSLKQMVKLGKVYYAEKGTKVIMLSKGFLRAKVEIVKTGRVGLVPTVYVAKE
jgi:hypothetical protein